MCHICCVIKMYNDKDLTTVRKVSPVLYNVCIAMKLP